MMKIKDPKPSDWNSTSTGKSHIWGILTILLIAVNITVGYSMLESPALAGSAIAEIELEDVTAVSYYKLEKASDMQ